MRNSSPLYVEGSLDAERTVNTFDFFFGLNLGQRLFSHTDNLSRTLQHTKMSALSGKRVACLTKDVLEKMRNDTSCRSFCDVVLLKSKSYPSMSGPMLPRRTRAPRRIEIGTGEPTCPVTAQDYYRRIYFEAIDLMMNAIDQLFDQPRFHTFAKMESLSIKSLNSQDKSEELMFVEKTVQR